MKLSKLQTLAWLAGILSCLIAIIVNWERIKQFLKICWTWFGGLFAWTQWFSHPMALPVWVLLLVFLFGGIFVFIIYSVARSINYRNKHSIPPSQPAQPDWHNFVSDEIFGVLWQWSYYGNTINDTALAAFCPRPGCMNRLEIDFDPQNPNLQGYHNTLPETMNCHRCGFKCHFDCDRRTLIRRVIDEIERLIHTGQYVERLKTKP